MIGGEFRDGGRSKQNMMRARKVQTLVVAGATESCHLAVRTETFSMVSYYHNEGDVNCFCFIPAVSCIDPASHEMHVLFRVDSLKRG